MKPFPHLQRHRPGTPPPAPSQEIRIVVLAAGLTDLSHLFASLAPGLDLPGWTGKNWNALRDVLEDLEWLEAKQVLLFHETLPELPAEELRFYLKILDEAVAFWQADGSRQLLVSIPKGRPDTKAHSNKYQSEGRPSQEKTKTGEIGPAAEMPSRHALPNPICPLCGKPNGCAAAKHGRLDVDCWCNHATMNPASLALVPEALRHKACLCPDCAKAPPASPQSSR